jgi:hypothetical protein
MVGLMHTTTGSMMTALTFMLLAGVPERAIPLRRRSVSDIQIHSAVSEQTQIWSKKNLILHFLSCFLHLKTALNGHVRATEYCYFIFRLLYSKHFQTLLNCLHMGFQVVN